jgi:CHASE3 domain sensor protein
MRRYVLSMHRKFQIGAAVSLMIVAGATIVLDVREYRRDRDGYSRSYTRFTKKRDIVDAARNAISALGDAELRAQDYVLTGETVYSAAYAEDMRTWEDESAALELVAANDPATPIVQDFSKAGKQTLSELGLVVALYDKSGRDVALDRIRKSSGIVYLDQARSSVAKIIEVDGGASDGNSQIVIRSASSLRRLIEGAAVLFVLSVAGPLLLILEVRRDRLPRTG